MKLYTMAEVARILGCSIDKVNQLRWKRELGHIPGKPILITQEDLDDYLARQKAKEVWRATREGQF